MLVATIKRSAFQGMGKRVAKIKDFAQAGFALVAADHAGFDLHVASDQGTERFAVAPQDPVQVLFERSEEHTSELQSRLHLVCRLLLEKKKKTHYVTLTQLLLH